MAEAQKGQSRQG
jgi:hypothetical protein